MSCNYKAVKSRLLCLHKGELLSSWLSPLDLILPFSSAVTALQSFYSLLALQPFLLLAATSIFPAFLQQFHAPCAGSSAAGFTLLAGGENTNAFSWPVLLVSLPARKLGWLRAWLMLPASACAWSHCSVTWWHFSASRKSGNFLLDYILAHMLEVAPACATLDCIKILILPLIFLIAVSLTCLPLTLPPITFQ